ncbi:hypothetical protein QBC34DRAFT_464769 [Podospora aff. communis PSN243]|uniref:VWFA domain-containing protein n=1 Tax=Podospora aff. communis PSN243 TaxID=3040156 RepID=A0AAV9H2K1_9PEZI|nr:hypothetical protein QBC34DRAFT_464769 [Podospora aff. communis PSN243]
MHFSIPAVVFALVGPALGEPGISPASVNRKADPESSFQITKVVNTPEIPPKPDVVLLVDVTASMGNAIDNIKAELNTIIDTVLATQPQAQFAVSSFGDLRDPNGFQVDQPLTSKRSAVQAAVNNLRPNFGQDDDEDWIYALYKLATDSITFRPDSSRIIVLVGDEPSHDPSFPPSGDPNVTLSMAISALVSSSIRLIAVNVDRLDRKSQASAATSATGGTLLDASAPSAVAAEIIRGLTNLPITVLPSSSCPPGLAISFSPPSATLPSGSTLSFSETITLSKSAPQGRTLSCTTSFLLNGAPGGVNFTQTVTTPVNILGCDLCDPRPGKNLCDPTTSCTKTPFGTMCLTRPGYKADGVGDGENRKQWRLEWERDGSGGHEHRVAVKPGIKADTLCDRGNVGREVCREVVVGSCVKVKGEGPEGWGDL